MPSVRVSWRSSKQRGPEEFDIRRLASSHCLLTLTSKAGSLLALRSSTNVCSRDALERNESSNAPVRWNVDRTGWPGISPMSGVARNFRRVAWLLCGGCNSRRHFRDSMRRSVSSGVFDRDSSREFGLENRVCCGVRRRKVAGRADSGPAFSAHFPASPPLPRKHDRAKSREFQLGR